MTAISANYRELLPSEVRAVSDACADAWKDPSIPLRQYEIVTPELERFRSGGECAPFDALIRCFESLPDVTEMSLLDVGASGGYYSEVLSVAGIDVKYTAVDYSEAFAELARKLYPGIDFKVGDACALPFEDDSFDIVFSGANLMHIADYAKAIQEAARVAKRYVIFSRTPIVNKQRGETQFFSKEAYGIPCLEIHFGLEGFLHVCEMARLALRYSTPITNTNHHSFVFEKFQVEPYASNPNV